MFRRKIEAVLTEWKSRWQGQSAILLEGMHGVGKTTVVEAFGRTHYERFLRIDFAHCPPDVRRLFEDIGDLDFFFLRLQLFTRVELLPRRSLIVFDNVEYCPPARQAIKRLVKDRRYDYIETGAFVSHPRVTRDILIPSEEQRVVLRPMDFEEFLWATGDTTTFQCLPELLRLRQPLTSGVHQALMQRLQRYVLTGGLPGVVDCFLKTNSLKAVDDVRREMLTALEDEFRRFDPKGNLFQLLASVPEQLAKKTPRFAVSSVLPARRPGASPALIRALQTSQAVNAAYFTEHLSSAMASLRDLSRFRLFLADTGLFATLMFRNRPFEENPLYEDILANRHTPATDALYQNAVAQMLASASVPLRWHAFPNSRGTGSHSIDFLLSRDDAVTPVVVRPSGYAKNAALEAFRARHPQLPGERFLLWAKDVRETPGLRCLPLYAAPLLPALVAHAQAEREALSTR